MNVEQSTLVTPEYRYVARWFWSLEELAEACGCDGAALQALIAAGCAPGPIYALDADGDWWSALAASNKKIPALPPEAALRWYAPAAAWGLRRALAMCGTGATPVVAAAALRAHFVHRFQKELMRIDGAEWAFPKCFEAGELVGEAVEKTAWEEWNDWLSGAYAVCLRIFTARTCIAKETLAANLKRSLNGGEMGTKSDHLLVMAEELAGLILPFAPWERPTGTPGVTIDRLLRTSNLGKDFPYR